MPFRSPRGAGTGTLSTFFLLGAFAFPLDALPPNSTEDLGGGGFDAANLRLPKRAERRNLPAFRFDADDPGKQNECMYSRIIRGSDLVRRDAKLVYLLASGDVRNPGNRRAEPRKAASQKDGG